MLESWIAWLALGTALWPVSASPAPPTAGSAAPRVSPVSPVSIVSIVSIAEPTCEPELERLRGHTFRLMPRDPDTDGRDCRYVIDDIAGHGPPWVGHVRARATDLFLETADGQIYRLAGPLARKRIAGPGYKIWVIGELRERDGALFAQRIGVLAPARPVD